MDKETKLNNEAALEEETEALTGTGAPEESEQALTEPENGAAPEDEDDGAEYEGGEDDEEDEYEDEAEDADVVATKTTIDSDLLDFIIKVQMRQAKKNSRRNLLIGTIAAAVVATICLLNQQDVIGFVLWMAALLMFQSYWNSSTRSARKRLAKNEGQVWDYTFAEDGIHVGASVSAPCIKWSSVVKAWLEDGYYILEVKNSDVVVKAANLTESERNTVELLMLEHVSNCQL